MSDESLPEAASSDEPCEQELEGDEQAPGILESIAALFKLFIFPEPALETLYAAFWPRFVLTLGLAAVMVPLLGNFLVDDSSRYQGVFLLTNRYVELSPLAFTKYYFYIVGLGLGFWVFVGGLLQKYLLQLQKVEVTLLDSIAALAYSAFPALVIIFLRHCCALLADRGRLEFFDLEQLLALSDAFAPHAELSYTILSLLLLVASCWGIYLWGKCIELIAELPPTKIAINGALMLIIPTFVITAWLTLQLAVFSSTGEVRPSLDHIRDSIEMQRERGQKNDSAAEDY